jgi:archaellum biogenesis ATPase FlaH
MPQNTIEIVTFEHGRDNVPEPHALEWGDLAAVLRSPRLTACTCHLRAPLAPCAEKDGPAWSPAGYKNAALRANRNVVAVTALVLDFDGVSVSVLTQLWEALAGLRFIAHASHSDRPDDDYRCVRAVVELERPVPAAQWTRYRAAALEALGLVASVSPDPVTSDPARIYYFPARGEGAPFDFAEQDGRPLAVPDEFLIAPDAPSVADAPAASTNAERPPASPAVIAAAASALAAHAPAVQGQGGDKHTLVVAATLVHDYALADDEALPLFEAWNRTCSPPWGVSDLRTKLRNARRYASQQPYGWRRSLVEHPLPGLAGRAAPADATDGDARWSTLLGDIDVSAVRAVRVYSTGYARLDGMLGGGLWSGRLHAVAGPPGAGKTAWVVTLADHLQTQAPVLYVSTELEASELAARFAAPRLGVPWREIMLGTVSMRGALDSLRVRVVGCDRLDRDVGKVLSAVVVEADRMRDEYGESPVIVVDYMQQLIRGGDGENLRGRVGDVASSLRTVSQGLSCPVVSVLSVSRQYYGLARDTTKNIDDATTFLAAAKESGDVDYDCAVVLFLDVDHSESSGPSAARIAVAKCRHGETGFVGARFDGITGRWTESAEALEAIRGTRTGALSSDQLNRAVDEWIARIEGWAKESTDKTFTLTQLRDMKDPDDPSGRRGWIPKPVLTALQDPRRGRYLVTVAVPRHEATGMHVRKVLLPNDWGKK